MSAKNRRRYSAPPALGRTGPAVEPTPDVAPLEEAHTSDSEASYLEELEQMFAAQDHTPPSPNLGPPPPDDLPPPPPQAPSSLARDVPPPPTDIPPPPPPQRSYSRGFYNALRGNDATARPSARVDQRWAPDATRQGGNGVCVGMAFQRLASGGPGITPLPSNASVDYDQGNLLGDQPTDLAGISEAMGIDFDDVVTTQDACNDRTDESRLLPETFVQERGLEELRHPVGTEIGVPEERVGRITTLLDSVLANQDALRRDGGGIATFDMQEGRHAVNVGFQENGSLGLHDLQYGDISLPAPQEEQSENGLRLAFPKQARDQLLAWWRGSNYAGGGKSSPHQLYTYRRRDPPEDPDPGGTPTS